MEPTDHEIQSVPVATKALIVTRDVSFDECHWLDREYKKGDIVYEFWGVTYGAISADGVAITSNADGSGPFMELPDDAVEPAGGAS